MPPPLPEIFVLTEPGLLVVTNMFMVFTVDRGKSHGTLSLVADGRPYTRPVSIGGKIRINNPGAFRVYPMAELREVWNHMIGAPLVADTPVPGQGWNRLDQSDWCTVPAVVGRSLEDQILLLSHLYDWNP